MGRFELAENIRFEFIETLQGQGAVVEDMASLARIYDDNILKPIFTRWDKLGREIFRIKQVGFVNVHVRSESPGFWGVRKKVLRDFEIIEKNLKTPCCFVLLVKDDSTDVIRGYILKDICSPPLIEHPSEQENDYKINEKSLDQGKAIKSLVNIVSELLAFGQSKHEASSSKFIRRKKQRPIYSVS